VAKVMVSLPDDLLGAVDAEAARRGTSRSAVLQAGARHELGLVVGEEREAVLAELDNLSRRWRGPVDAAALVRGERHRDD
jgi:Ribbon-helix-helix protein, copG family